MEPRKITVLLLAGLVSACASGGAALSTHTKGLASLTEDQYVPAKKPVDRHFIGAAWSRQFGPVLDLNADEVRVKKEHSFSGVQQDYAHNLGFALEASLTGAPLKGEAGVQWGGVEKSKLEGVEIITPLTLADIPFEPDLPYVTEALRLTRFKISAESSNKSSLSAGIGHAVGLGAATLEGGSQDRNGTDGEGLVVAYRLQTIDKSSYQKKDSGAVRLALEKYLDLPGSGVILKARLQTIEPGSGKSLPRDLLWACPTAESQRKNMVAAWVVEVKSIDPKRKGLAIAFPAHPKIADCQNFSRVIFSRIDPANDRIIRQKLSISLIDDELTESLKVKLFETRVSLMEESFKIKTVKPSDLE